MGHPASKGKINLLLSHQERMARFDRCVRERDREKEAIMSMMLMTMGIVLMVVGGQLVVANAT